MGYPRRGFQQVSIILSLVTSQQFGSNNGKWGVGGLLVSLIHDLYNVQLIQVNVSRNFRSEGGLIYVFFFFSSLCDHQLSHVNN